MALPLIALGLAGMGLNNLNNKVNEDRALGRQKRADDQALRDAGADVEPVIKEAASGMGPSAVMVGKQAYGTEGDAQAAADKFNAPDAKIARQQGALIAQGRPDASLELGEKAMKHAALRQKLTDAMKAEGIGDFIDGNMALAPKVEDIEAGKAGLFDFNPEDVKKFNAVGGKVTIGEGQKGRWTTFELPNGRKVADFEVVDAEGKPVAPSARAIQLIAQMTAQSREELGDKQFEQGKKISVAQQGVDIQKQYKDGLLDVARDRAQTYENGYGRGGGRGNGAGGDPIERMHPADKLAYTEAAGEAKAIQQAILKSTAEGSWDPSQNPQQFALLQQMEVAKRRASGVLSRYSQPEDAAPMPRSDPYGIRDTIESAAPPAFDVRGDPAAFRKNLEGKVDASVLAAFDAKYPQANKKAPRADAPAAAQSAGQPSPAQGGSSPGLLKRLGAMLPSQADGEASVASAMEREALQLLRSGAKAPMELMLRQNGQKLSPETRARLQAAIKAKA